MYTFFLQPYKYHAHNRYLIENITNNQIKRIKETRIKKKRENCKLLRIFMCCVCDDENVSDRFNWLLLCVLSVCCISGALLIHQKVLCYVLCRSTSQSAYLIALVQCQFSSLCSFIITIPFRTHCVRAHIYATIIMCAYVKSPANDYSIALFI